jgi:hypothetical protein
MTTRKPPPFTLPEEPVDQYEVFWWSVESYSDIPRIVASRAVYHMHTTWEELFDADDRPPGAPFIKQWQIFRNGAFTGRGHDHESSPTGDGWSDWHNFDWFGTYAMRAEAVVAARRLASERLASFVQSANALREWLNTVDT